MRNESWAKTVSIRVADGDMVIRNTSDALSCLAHRWPGKSNNPSYRRALRDCEAALNGDMSEASARAALIVAAMASGLRYEVHDDELGPLEAEISRVSRDMVWEERFAHI
jgi:hypothetical protein